MRVLGEIGNKIVWFVIILFVFGIGYVWVLKTFLNPPAVVPTVAAPLPVTSNPTPAAPNSVAFPVVPSPAPVATSSSVTSPSPDASNPSLPSSAGNPSSSSQLAPAVNEPTPAAGEPSPVAATPNDANNTVAPQANSQVLPALALPEQVALQVPKKLEMGGILKIYYNNDNNSKPDPILYSPLRVLKTPGLNLIPTNEDKFSEASGYFLVDKYGIYNFATILPTNNYMDLDDIRVKIDGTLLPNVKGGRLELERGWHYVTLFMKTGRYDPKLVRVSVGREGETLKPLQVWREAATK